MIKPLDIATMRAKAASLRKQLNIPGKVDLHNYDLVIINSSGGKDSLASIYEIDRLAKLQVYPKSKIVVSHQDLGEAEWNGTTELARKQAEMFGYPFYVSKQRNMYGEELSIRTYAERKKKPAWPDSKNRWCTSDFKRGPGARIVTAITKDLGNKNEPANVLYVFGFRAQESASRRNKEVLSVNKKLTTQSRKVFDFLPIHDWTEQQVWDTIKGNGLPYHPAYDLGMPRLSCCFCIYANKDALVLAGKHNRELLDKYVATEEKIGHKFKSDLSLKEVRELIDQGYEPNPKKLNFSSAL